MKNILVLGAGKSATALISYLLQHAPQFDWHVTVGDMDEQLAAQKISGNLRGTAIKFDVQDDAKCRELIQQADIVASVLPATFHYKIALYCLEYGKSIVTPSYISDKERALDAQFRQAGLLFMGEMGLDPGIDHMSLMQMVEHIRQQGGALRSVKSFCGALIAPESDTNPWHYKFTWAPMNVVLAGQGGTAQYLHEGQPKYVPYNRLFQDYEVYEIPQCGSFEAYPNRDSIAYIEKYGLEEVLTFQRGTLRHRGFCDAWNALIQIGLTDNNFQVLHPEKLTRSQLTGSFLPASGIGKSVVERLAKFLNTATDSHIMHQLKWLGILDDEPIGKPATPAMVLHDLLAEKWQFQPNDRDLIVMLHEFVYMLNGDQYRTTSTMTALGTDIHHTAIAYTVGYPMAIMVKMILQNEVALTGVQMPIMPEVYNPMLEELKAYGIVFDEYTHIV